MNEQDYTLIQQYFNGLLSPEDASAVEARAATESVFGAAFALPAGAITILAATTWK
jgi:hypothetical protein